MNASYSHFGVYLNLYFKVLDAGTEDVDDSKRNKSPIDVNNAKEQLASG